MHVIVREAKDLSEAAEPQDLNLAPADLVVLSFSDSDLASIVQAWTSWPDNARPSLAVANLGRLLHPMSVDLFAEATLARTKAVLVRLLGGLDYWRYGGEQLSKRCRALGVTLAIVPGDGRPDPRLAALSTVSAKDLTSIETLLDAGGVENTLAAVKGLLARANGSTGAIDSASVVPGFGVYRAPKIDAGALGYAVLAVYRSHVLAGDTEPFDALAAALEARGLATYVLFVPSLKAPDAAAWMAASLASLNPAIVVNATAFAARDGADVSPLDAGGCAVLQVATAGTPQAAWATSQRGLTASDLAMHVVLPELDGRIFSGAISFKETDAHAKVSGAEIVRQVPFNGGVRHTADLAAAWARLKKLTPAHKKIALLLSTYPGRPDQIAHAVGLDALESTLALVRAMREAGYDVGGVPLNRRDLIACLDPEQSMLWPISSYRAVFEALPSAFKESVTDAWGEPEADTFAKDGAFVFRIHRFGNVIVGLQPERGLAADRKAQYHDPATPPRHSYIAFYAWLRHVANIDALIHLGAHGTLEWLPGKAVALSESCGPEAVLGATPLIYPFIVNDPGEAAQAKRRTAAVTIGHKPPPLVETEFAPEMTEVERLVDEFSSAQGLDGRRRKALSSQIVDAALRAGIAQSCGLTPELSELEAIARIDAFLCDLKELSIRDGLHVLDTTEMSAVVRALDGGFVAPGPSGAPSRGRADVLPTGRNLFTIDPRSIPTQTAWANGKRAAGAILERYLSDHGEWPRAIVLDLWGSATLRTGGEELATALALLGVRPVWDTRSYRVTGVETSPPAELGRPRVDVTLRISGLFRDMFAAQLSLFEHAVQLVASLNEDAADNPLVASAKNGDGLDRIYGPASGTFGAGVMSLIDRRDWQNREQLGESYIAASSEAFRTRHSQTARGAFVSRVRNADAFVHIQDHREIDLLTGGDFAAHEGGFAAAAASLGNDRATLYHGDTGEPEAPRVRTLQEECARVVHGRATSPRWIGGQMRHGFRGAAEMAATVDAAFAFAATARAVDNGGFERLYQAYLGDPTVAAFVTRENPAALEAMRSRFEEAISRGLWQPRRNDVLAAAATQPREAAE